MKQTLENWKKQHNYLKVYEEVISFIDTEIGNKTLLLLHDFGTNSYSYNHQLNELKEEYRVIAPDFIGFGLSDKPRSYYYSIFDQAQVIIHLLRTLKVTDFAVVCQGYGAAVFAEILSQIEAGRLNFRVRNIMLLNGSMTIELVSGKSPKDLISNTVNSGFSKISYSYALFKKYFGMSLADAKTLSDTDYSLFWSLLSERKGQKFIQFIDYCIVERKQFSKRWLKAYINAPCTIDLVWGANDPLSPLHFAEKLHQLLEGSNLHTVESCGHFPSLETPNTLIQKIKTLNYENNSFEH